MNQKGGGRFPTSPYVEKNPGVHMQSLANTQEKCLSAAPIPFSLKYFPSSFVQVLFFVCPVTASCSSAVAIVAARMITVGQVPWQALKYDG